RLLSSVSDTLFDSRRVVIRICSLSSCLVKLSPMPCTKPIRVALHGPRLTGTINPCAMLLSRLLLFYWKILYWAPLHRYAQLLLPSCTLRSSLTGMRPFLDQGRLVAFKVSKRSSVFHNTLSRVAEGTEVPSANHYPIRPQGQGW